MHRAAASVLSGCAPAESSTAYRIAVRRWCTQVPGRSTLAITPSPLGLRVRVQAQPRTFHTCTAIQSGHNRWSKIRHRKGAADAQKSTIFSRLTNDIHAALRPPGSSDPVVNSRLATALAKAKEGGVPKNVVENCFARARAAADGTGQSVVYEAIGPGGREAMMIETITENPARTVQRLKEILHKNNCRIAPVAYMFEKKGIIIVSSRDGAGFDELFELALEGGAEDVREADGIDDAIYEIVSAPSELSGLNTVFAAPPNSLRFPIISSELCYVPTNPLEVLGEDQQGDGITEERAEGLEKVADALTLEGDVVKVWTNLA